MLRKVVVLPGCQFFQIAADLAALGWTLEPARTVTPPMVAGEPELSAWRRDDEDARAVYTFNPVVGLRVIEFDGERAAQHESDAAAHLPIAEVADVERWLRSLDVREKVRGILAAENLDTVSLLPLIAPLRTGDDVVARAATRAARKLALRQFERGLEEIARRKERAPDRSALFALFGGPTERRQMLRWLMRDRGGPSHPIDAEVLKILRAALADADWEVRVTAMLAAARLGARDLLGEVRRLRLPEGPRDALDRDDCDILAAIHQAAVERLAGARLPSLSPDPPSYELVHLRLRRYFEGQPLGPEDRLSLLLRSLVEPLELSGPGPEPLPPSIVALDDGDGYRLARSGIALRFIPAIPHWLGVEGAHKALPNPIRKQRPAAGFFIATYLLTREQARRIAPALTLVVSEEDARPVQTSLDEAVKLCEALGRIEGALVTLPSADEWEMAARGPDGRQYPWGNGVPDSPARTGSPWGVEDLWRVPGQWTSALTGAGEPIVCGAHKRPQPALRTLAADELFAVRPIVRLADSQEGLPRGRPS